MIPDPTTECASHPAGFCGRCGALLMGKRTKWCSTRCRLHYYQHHLWRYARREAMRRAKRKCARCGGPGTEVDHIVPRKGMSLGTWSCLHHQSNLRVLCHADHVNRRFWDEANN